MIKYILDAHERKVLRLTRKKLRLALATAIAKRQENITLNLDMDDFENLRKKKRSLRILSSVIY